MYKIRPYITEKSVALTKNAKYSFIVDNELDKVNIIKILKNAFKVNPIKVNIITKKPRIKKTARKKIKVSGFKKAIVELKKGEKIPGFEILDEKNEQAQKQEKTKNGK